MKLRNKKTGEIAEFEDITRVFKFIGNQNTYTSLAKLNEEWEDYEEPKTCWYLDCNGEPTEKSEIANYYNPAMIEIGNYFKTKEEAEKAVEKLKALANLRKRGLKFNGWDSADRGLVGEFEIYCDAVNLDGIEQELELVFGREEI